MRSERSLAGNIPNLATGDKTLAEALAEMQQKGSTATNEMDKRAALAQKTQPEAYTLGRLGQNAAPAVLAGLLGKAAISKMLPQAAATAPVTTPTGATTSATGPIGAYAGVPAATAAPGILKTLGPLLQSGGSKILQGAGFGGADALVRLLLSKLGK
jgi:hypothetical protein